MAVSATNPSVQIVRLTMPPDCSVRSIAEIAGRARDQLATARDLALDCAGVETADITFVQLVVSAQRSFAAQGLTLTLADAPPAVLAAFARAAVPLSAITSSPSGAR